MSFTQLSAGILSALFALTTIGSELVLVADKANDKRLAAGSWNGTGADVKERLRRDNQSPWETREMMPSGPKF